MHDFIWLHQNPLCSSGQWPSVKTPNDGNMVVIDEIRSSWFQCTSMISISHHRKRKHPTHYGIHISLSRTASCFGLRSRFR